MQADLCGYDVLEVNGVEAGGRDQAIEQGQEGGTGAVVETVFADLKPLERFTIPGPNATDVFIKRTPATYQSVGGGWVYEVYVKCRKRMVVARV